MSVDSTSKALSLIFNRSQMFEEILSDWESAHVVPIFKNDSKNDENNYKSVCLTSIISKLLESIIRDQVQMFLNEKKAIYPSQHGFTKGKSCLTNLIKFVNNIFEWYDQDNSLDIIYQNFSKTFDKFQYKRVMGFKGMS